MTTNTILLLKIMGLDESENKTILDSISIKDFYTEHQPKKFSYPEGTGIGKHKIVTAQYK